jgi:hypothetical protein
MRPWNGPQQGRKDKHQWNLEKATTLELLFDKLSTIQGFLQGIEVTDGLMKKH